MAYLLIGCTGQIYLLTVDYVINLPDKDLKDMKYFQLGHILLELKDLILHIDKVHRISDRGIVIPNAMGTKFTPQNIYFK